MIGLCAWLVASRRKDSLCVNWAKGDPAWLYLSLKIASLCVCDRDAVRSDRDAVRSDPMCVCV